MVNVFTLTPAGAAQALRDNGLDALGLTAVSLSPAWGPAAPTYDASALTLSFTNLPRAPWRGIFEYVDSAAAFRAVDGTPLRGAAAVLARGPKAVIVKQGARGASLFTLSGAFTVPAYPAVTVDPTGAGDALGGAFVGRLARSGLAGDAGYRDALVAGAAAASVAVESFGVDALARVSLADLDARAAALAGRSGTGSGAALYEGR